MDWKSFEDEYLMKFDFDKDFTKFKKLKFNNVWSSKFFKILGKDFDSNFKDSFKEDNFLSKKDKSFFKFNKLRKL